MWVGSMWYSNFAGRSLDSDAIHIRGHYLGTISYMMVVLKAELPPVDMRIQLPYVIAKSIKVNVSLITQ